jgi:hypothetical protein
MSQKLHSFFKVKPTKSETTNNCLPKPKGLSFGPKSVTNFNYVDFKDPDRLYGKNRAELHKQMYDSYLLEIEKDNKNPEEVIAELKLTNFNVLTWEDYWIDANSKQLIDPKISSINLQKNSLSHVNFNLTRQYLTSLNLEGNPNLQTVLLYETPKLEVLNLSNCPGLNVVNLGFNRNLKTLLARNCQLSSQTQERLLRDFTPTLTSSSNSSFNMFRKKYETILDLRGSNIDWGNRRIASKIRLLLCNNWMVLWDNPPPTSIVPPQMYSFFTNSLEDSLIRNYYK